MDKYIGTMLDNRYRINELIGEGGMSNVYKAEDTVGRRTVAVKILREEFSHNQEFLRRFRNESRATAALSHNNIVKIYDVAFTDNVQYIVMEYIYGVPLNRYITHNGKVEWKKAAYFTAQVLSGLEHAHSKGIVHRDIKPHNIMLMADGTVKIMDFGIARFSRSETTNMSDQAIGSVHYISPEQARGEDTDARTDIYSVGVMLYEMLTGKVPFEADTPASVALKHIQSEPESPRSLNPNIPPRLEAITMKAMQKKVDDRYASAKEMLDDLKRFLEDPNAEEEKAQEAQGENMQNQPNGEEKKKVKSKKYRSVNDTYKPLPVIPILTGITVAFVLAAALFIMGMIRINNPFRSPDDVRIPELVGLTYDNIINDPTYTDSFDIQIEETSYQEGYEQGVIYSQQPKEGRIVKKGSIITVKVCGAAETMIMEDYTDQPSSEVGSKLEGLGLTYTEQQVYHPKIAAGNVVKTDPPAGETFVNGTEVTVYVSVGSNVKQTEVPDITGLSMTEAREKLAEKGLSLGSSEGVEAPDKANGQIVEQSPAAGEYINEGGRVNIKVSEGNTTIKRVAVTFPVPSGSISVQAKQDGKIVEEDEISGGSWRVIFDGSGTSNIEIIVNGSVYKKYLLNFDNATHTEITE